MAQVARPVQAVAEAVLGVRALPPCLAGMVLEGRQWPRRLPGLTNRHMRPLAVSKANRLKGQLPLLRNKEAWRLTPIGSGMGQPKRTRQGFAELGKILGKDRPQVAGRKWEFKAQEAGGKVKEKAAGLFTYWGLAKLQALRGPWEGE